MGLIVSLIIIGLVLILAEILLIPGVGVAGVLGLLSMGGSCYYAFYEFGNLTGGIVTGVNSLLLVVTLIYVLRAKTWKRMTLETNIQSKAVSDDSALLSVGDKGKTVTRLAPMGSARFGDHVIEVKALEGMVDPDVRVRVVLIEDNKIYVETVEEEL
jgi:membrane-bound ClpP family serine protease